MPTRAEQTAALVDAYAARRDRATAAAVSYATTQLDGFDGWYDRSATASFAARIAARVRGVQGQVAGATDAFLARTLALQSGRPVRPAGAIDVRGGLRRGVDPLEVYGRTADTYRFRIAEQDPPVEALQRATVRLQVMVEMDVALAARDQASATLSRSTVAVAGYRRVIHPELAKGGSCGLCIAASDRVYAVAELLPIHERCNCTVLPILGDMGGDGDPGLRINADDLARLYEEAGGTAGKALKRTRYVVVEHGELGPLLRVDGQKFRGPDDVESS